MLPLGECDDPSQLHRNIAGAGKMKCRSMSLWILAGCIAMIAPALCGHAQNQDDKSKQQPAPQLQPNGNPFPEDESTVPMMPSDNVPDVIDDTTVANSPDAAPPRDTDPVKSPEGMAPSDESGATEGFSSSRNGLDNVVPETSDTEPANNKKKGKKDDSLFDTTPRETPEKDIDVGNYYIDNKDWRGALSRFQSALVLAPDNPDVYWGLAECYRHLGQFSEARANYEKVAEYDPDSKHGKEAKKALKDPQLANAGPSSTQK